MKNCVRLPKPKNCPSIEAIELFPTEPWVSRKQRPSATRQLTQGQPLSVAAFLGSPVAPGPLQELPGLHEPNSVVPIHPRQLRAVPKGRNIVRVRRHLRLALRLAPRR